MSEENALARMLYFPGRRVRLLKPGSDKPDALFGLILKVMDLPDRPPSFMVEYERLDDTGKVRIDVTLLDVSQVEMVPIDHAQLSADLLGRKANFPWKSGIGVDFPKDADQTGVIVAVRFEDGMPKIGVRIRLENGGEQVLDADFTQCDLVPRSEKKDAPDP